MSRKPHYAWLILTVAWLAFMGVGLIRFVYPYVVPTMEETLGISHAVMGIIISGFFWADTVMRIVWGMLSDRFGTRLTTLLGLALLSVGFFIMSFATGISSLVIGFIVSGVGAAALFIMPSPLLSRWFGQSRRSTAIGIVTTAATAVTIVAGFIVPVVLTNHLYNVIWRTEAIFVLVILAVNFFVLADSPAEKGLTPYGASVEELDAIKVTSKGNVWDRESILRVLKDGAFYQIAGSYFVYGVAYTGVLTFLVGYFKEVGWTAGAASHLVALFGMAGLIGALVWGAVGDRLAKRHVFGMTLGMQGLGILVLVLAGQTPAMAYLGVILFGLGGSGPVVMIAAIQADYFDRSTIGTSFGLCAACFSIASAVSPIIGGVLADSTGTLRSALLMGLVGSLIGAVLISLLAEPRTVKAVPKSR